MSSPINELHDVLAERKDERGNSITKLRIRNKHGNSTGTLYLVQTKKAYIFVNAKGLYDLTDLMDEVCDMIADGEF